jgi:hypothetical protein
MRRPEADPRVLNSRRRPFSHASASFHWLAAAPYGLPGVLAQVTRLLTLCGGQVPSKMQRAL